MRWRIGLAVWLMMGIVAASPPGVSCESCHPAETHAYRKTRMSSAMLPALASGFAQHAESAALTEPGGGYRFLYRSTASDLKVLAVRGPDHAVGTIDWVLGSGAQAQTPIVQTEAGFFESHVSFFPNLEQYGITIGQPSAASANATAALGRAKTPAQLSECLGCHSVVQDAAFTRIEPGVQCEQCHPGAVQHAANPQGRPVNPGHLKADTQVRLCGNCHRSSSPGNGTELENVRFQPLRLMKSRCFVVGQVACTTCHAAHQDARRNDAAFYNAKCTSCHAGSTAHRDARAAGNCIGCHMPQLQLHPALRFTDHYIRVVNASDYPAGAVTERTGG